MTITVIEPAVGGPAAAVLGTATPNSTKRKFTKCTAYNSTGAPVTIKIFLVPSGAAPNAVNTYVDYDIAPRETYNCPEVVGAALNPLGTLQVQGAGVYFSAVASDTLNN